MMLSNEKKILVSLLVGSLAVFVGYCFMFVNIKAKNEKSSLLLQEIELEKRRDESIRSVGAIVNNTSSDIDKLNSYFVAKDGVVPFIESVESLGRRAKVSVSVDSIATGPIGNSPSSGANSSSSGTGSSTVEVLKIAMNTIGDWRNVFYFLSLLEVMPYRLTITDADINFATKSIDSKTNISQWKGIFSLYVLKLK